MHSHQGNPLFNNPVYTANYSINNFWMYSSSLPYYPNIYAMCTDNTPLFYFFPCTMFHYSDLDETLYILNLLMNVSFFHILKFWQLEDQILKILKAWVIIFSFPLLSFSFVCGFLLFFALLLWVLPSLLLLISLYTVSLMKTI